MADAYRKASDDGKGGALPVKPRQIMYAARAPDARHDRQADLRRRAISRRTLLIDYMRDTRARRPTGTSSGTTGATSASRTPTVRSASARWRCGTTSRSIHEPEISRLEIAAARVSRPMDRRAAMAGSVHREGGLRPDHRRRRACTERYRPRADVDQGHDGHAGADAGRGAVRQARPAAVRPARFRQERLLDS